MIKAATLSTSHSMTDDQSTAFMAHSFDYTYTGQLQQELGLYIQGTGNDDTLWGTGGNDGIYGVAGNDILHGGMGKDILDGGDGNDILDGGAGADQLIGGSGIDTATYINATSGVWADLSHGGVTGEAQGDTYTGVENLTGSNFDDILVGDAGNNVINGGAGGDWIVAGAGNDTLIGGSGNNVFNGGDGSDIFVIAKNDGAVNNVQDFQFNIDKVDLHGFSSSDLGTDGMLAHGFFSVDSHGNGWLNWPNSTFNQSDSLFFREDTHQLIQVDHSAANLYDAVANGTVLATFSNGETIHTSDLLFT